MIRARTCKNLQDGFSWVTLLFHTCMTIDCQTSYEALIYCSAMSASKAVVYMCYSTVQGVLFRFG